ncbi:penicillin-binding protein 1B [Acidihalobacter ferrooxydans]|uniref:Penicillin-binding protein 1B n=1 Tax=Acidihalobacter ferrooxydans TaxID=1765967 RepID=A0A1P8UI62_9GAMM|nr:penicillin-binding protein 1B [Acidihalobacter ferrooxydans]APZ43451.1 penicillin-binding protein 1B [Acidihalobacter ferrooxydans]
MAKSARSRKRSSRKPARTAAQRRHSGRPRRRLWWALAVLAVMAAGVGGYVAYLNHLITSQFEAKRYALPARVYAAPLELYAGARLDAAAVGRALRLLKFERTGKGAAQPGTYAVQGDGYLIHTRGFTSPDGNEPSRTLAVRFAQGRVASVSTVSGRTVALARLSPLLIAKIYPLSHEDRILVRLDALPPLLPKALVAVEDRRFYLHHGVDPVAIGRALVVDLRARRFVQGGSTLTQQLVKNFYLSNRRSLWRKFNEAIMAVLLELHYDKRTILETYLNEVYLGQDGQRAIHGVGLASEFYFGKPVQQLDTAQIALLVALVRGPTYYDPRRHPARALARRNRVLRELHAAGELDAASLRRAQAAPLGVIAKPPSSVTPFPDFLDLVRRQLGRDYRAQDLRTQGLVIYTTLRPLVQVAAQRAVDQGLRRLEARRDIKRDTLEAAAVVTSVENGEVYAVVGGRRANFDGYNRALDARRSIGSLFKAATYLTALEQPQRYTLATLLDDSPLHVRTGQGQQVWSPLNYDRRNHGKVPLMDALVHSYNVSSARLGLDLGLPAVIRTAHALGIKQPIAEYPAILLGAVPVPPLEVAQMYQTLAAGGYRAPLRAIQTVVDPRGNSLQRYPLKIERAAPESAVYLLDAALHDVTRRGTARSLKTLLPAGLEVAGKTGTTNDLRDSWFAGFGGNAVAVVWVGRDDNRPAGLTGATGALPIWAAIMRGINAQSLHITQPADVTWTTIDPQTGLRTQDYCPGAQWMAFIKGSEPSGTSSCQVSATRRALEWFKGLLK